MMQSPSAAALFDYNVFSPSGPVNVQVGGKTLPLSRFLDGGTMPHTEVKPGVHVVQHDIARISGIETVDRGQGGPGPPVPREGAGFGSGRAVRVAV